MWLCILYILGTFEDLAILMSSDMPAQRCLGLVGLATFRTQVGFLTGVAQHVGCQVVLTATGMWTKGALEGLDAFMDPYVFLKV